MTKYGSHIFAAAKAINADTLTKQSQPSAPIAVITGRRDILWNTVYRSRAVDYVRTQSIDIPAELLSQVAPLPWAHIALTSDYLWNEIDGPLERFRPIRANRFNPNNLAFP